MAGLGVALTLISSLAQTVTNGLSILGTVESAILPPFLTDNPISQGFPWGSLTASNTNPYELAPVTGIIRSYDFTISQAILAPDGVEREVMLVNGAFPGPLIEANWGDTIQVNVHNNLTDEGTSLHWHGFLQKSTPWFDGVPGITQCPIAPGKSLTYQFQAELYGSSWYHSHYSAQYSAGISGPIVIHGPRHVEYDIDLGPVILSDWYHTQYLDLVEQTLAPGGFPHFNSDSNMINGKANYDCSQTSLPCTANAGLSKFILTPGKTHLLRLINTGAEGTQQFSIDGHNLTVIANDFVPVIPYQTQYMTLGVGQRSDVLITAHSDKLGSDAYWMRSTLVCSAASNPPALAAVYYDGSDPNSAPKTNSSVTAVQCINDDLEETEPFYPFGATQEPAVVQEISITYGPNGSHINVWSMNGIPFRVNYDNPVLLLANLGNTSYPDDPQWNVYDFGSNSSIRLVVQNYVPSYHPMHLHGHNFFVLAQGVGTWNGTVSNPQNPQRRDVQILPAAVSADPGYIVLQINTDNPGVWPFHCHIAWHVSAGLYVSIMERPNDIQDLRVPSTMAQTCRDWADYAGHDVVDQIDSGL